MANMYYFAFFVFVAMFCVVFTAPFEESDDLIDVIYFDHHNNHTDKFNRTGERVKKWHRNMSVNPEELGEYVEGDIMVPMGKSGLINTVYRWPGGVVPYVIAGTFTTAERNLIMSAISDFHTNTCIRFVTRTTQTNYIVIKNAVSGCWSYLGRIGGAQDLNLQNPGCVTVKGTAIHEFMHALGIIHEHSRPERNNFVTILLQNVISSATSNFNTYSTTQVSSFGVTYDYGSVMHYGAYAFSANGLPTIVPKISGVTIGQRSGFSLRDIQTIKAMYNCP